MATEINLYAYCIVVGKYELVEYKAVDTVILPPPRRTRLQCVTRRNVLIYYRFLIFKVGYASRRRNDGGKNVIKLNETDL